MAEFKLGDKVQVREDAHFYSNDERDMFRKAGFLGEVTRIIRGNVRTYRVAIPNGHIVATWDNFADDELELVASVQQVADPRDAELSRLRHACALAEAALKPFAAIGAILSKPTIHPDYTGDKPVYSLNAAELTRADFLRAADALAAMHAAASGDAPTEFSCADTPTDAGAEGEQQS